MGLNYIDWLIKERNLPPCQNCNSHESLRHIIASEGKHYAKIVCDHCQGRFVAWGAKPNTKKTRRPADHKGLLEKYQKATEQDYCEICFRTKADLPPNETLEVHHVIEYQDGGSSDVSNLRLLCTKHHSLVHHERTYFQHYLTVKPTAEAA